MSHPVDKHVGKRLRMKRSVLGMSQDELAKRLGLTFQQVQKYERGVNRIGSSRLYEISQILGVSVGYFFDDFEAREMEDAVGFAESEAAVFKEEKLESKETMSLIRAYYSIDNAPMRKKVLALMKALGSETKTENDNEADEEEQRA